MSEDVKYEYSYGYVGAKGQWVVERAYQSERALLRSGYGFFPGNTARRRVGEWESVAFREEEIE